VRFGEPAAGRVAKAAGSRASGVWDLFGCLFGLDPPCPKIGGTETELASPAARAKRIATVNLPKGAVLC